MAKKLYKKTSFIKTWIMMKIIDNMKVWYFTSSPLLHDPSDYNTWQGFENEKNNHYL